MVHMYVMSVHQTAFGTLRIELLVQHVVQFLGKVRIPCGGSLWLGPLGTNVRLPYVFANGTF